MRTSALTIIDLEPGQPRTVHRLSAEQSANPGERGAAAPLAARRILQRLDAHYTPKHASWLNMVEIEISVLRGQCLDRRIGERDVLVAEIAAWQKQRNASGARVKWKFTARKARAKLARAYPDIANKS